LTRESIIGIYFLLYFFHGEFTKGCILGQSGLNSGKEKRNKIHCIGRRTMKKRGLLIVLGSLCLVFMLAAPSVAQVIKLTLADQNPSTGWGGMNAMAPWAKKVEDATKGRVKIDVYYNQTLAKGPDIWNAVKSGVADIGWCFHGYWTDMTPLFDMITLPSLPYKTAEEGSEIIWKLYEKFPAMQREFKDVHVLQLWASQPRFLITTKKQVKTLEDLKGLKLRIPGGPATDQMKALGGIPVLLPMPDTYLSMDKGVIDGMDVSWEATYSFRLYEIIKFYTFVPLSSTNFSMAMNKQKWESLPKDIQAAITSVCGLEGSKFFGRNWYDTVQNAVLEQIKKGNYQMNSYTIPPDEAERWRKVGSEAVWKAWVKKLESKGYPEAQQVLDTALAMINK
jgi:TRAP-type C4-dicarboxylate transport system substrate-binding protein